MTRTLVEVQHDVALLHLREVMKQNAARIQAAAIAEAAILKAQSIKPLAGPVPDAWRLA
jgi:hypothetical protein